MKQNTLEKLFAEANKKDIKYCVRGRYKHFPRTLDNGDVDLLIAKKNFQSFLNIIKSLNFQFYPFTQPNLFYYLYDSSLGLIQLDILLTNQFPEVKKYKSFYIPKDERRIPNNKSFLRKVYTFFRRKLHQSFNGPVIVFEGPDGSGKSTNVRLAYDSLARFGLKKEIVHFATPFNKNGSKPSSFKRLYTRVFSILRVWKNVIFGSLTITDRYIYLTLRKRNKLLKNILRKLAPKPNIIFLMRSNVKTIRERKKGQRDQLNEELIKELYEIYENIEGVNIVNINTEKPAKQNIDKIVNLILEASCKT